MMRYQLYEFRIRVRLSSESRSEKGQQLQRGEVQGSASSQTIRLFKNFSMFIIEGVLIVKNLLNSTTL